MEQKRHELKSQKQRKLLEDIVARLASEHPSFYYLPTVEVAAKIEQVIRTGDQLSVEQRELLEGLGRRDIQILLSIRQS